MKPGMVAQLVVSMVIALVTVLCLTRAEYVPSDAIPSEDEDNQLVKRPFCNAFTGCGRKRSDENEVLSNGDAFIRKLGRHIMRQAQLRGIYQSKLNSKSQQPWLDYLADRKKRMAPVEFNDDFSSNN